MKYYLTLLLALCLVSFGIATPNSTHSTNINQKLTNDSIVILCDTLFIYEEDPETGELNLNLDIYCDTVVVDW
jgi:hypothetical protein